MTGHSSDDGDSIRVNPANDITAAPPPSIPRPSSSSASTVGSADMTTSTPSSSTKKSVLVYHHQPKGAPVVKNGLAVLTLAQLDAVLTARESDPPTPPSDIFLLPISSSSPFLSVPLFRSLPNHISQTQNSKRPKKKSQKTPATSNSRNAISGLRSSDHNMLACRTRIRNL